MMMMMMMKILRKSYISCCKVQIAHEIQIVAEFWKMQTWFTWKMFVRMMGCKNRCFNYLFIYLLTYLLTRSLGLLPLYHLFKSFCAAWAVIGCVVVNSNAKQERTKPIGHWLGDEARWWNLHVRGRERSGHAPCRRSRQGQRSDITRLN